LNYPTKGEKLMQTKLRIMGFVVVASLLWTSPTSATQRAKVINTAIKLKVRYLGTASWYGKQRQGRKMANGKPFDSNKLTAASWYFPLGTPIRVVNVKNGQSVVVTVTDRGPNLRLHRIVDLSEAAAGLLDYVGQGLTQVFVYPLPAFRTASAAIDSKLAEPAKQHSPVEFEAVALSPVM
jgi:rare lipoprotein A